MNVCYFSVKYWCLQTLGVKSLTEGAISKIAKFKYSEAQSQSTQSAKPSCIQEDLISM